MAKEAETTTTSVTPREVQIQIDGKHYIVRKLKFGGQVELASIIAQVLKGMNTNVGNENSDTKGNTTFSLDIGTILSQAPDKFIRIAALGLGVDDSVVVNFENEEEVLEAVEKTLELNPVNKIMGKSTALLRNISLS